VQEESGKYIGYTGLLMNDMADIAVGGIIRTAKSTNLLDVITSYWKIAWHCFVPCPVKFPGWKSIFRIFSLSGWLSIFLAAMLAHIAIVFLARFRIQEEESFRRLVDAVLDVWECLYPRCRVQPFYVCSSQPGCATAWQSTQCSRFTSLRFWWLLGSRNQLQTW
jgi:hypothetical protein